MSADITFTVYMFQNPLSVNDGVMYFIVLLDLPICSVMSTCMALGFSFKKFCNAISSKVQFRVSSKVPF